MYTGHACAGTNRKQIVCARQMAGVALNNAEFNHTTAAGIKKKTRSAARRLPFVIRAAFAGSRGLMPFLFFGEKGHAIEADRSRKRCHCL